MKSTDLEIGKYYACKYYSKLYIFKLEENLNNVKYIFGHYFSTSSWAFYKEFSDLRPATPDEKYHLDLCIEANKFVSHTYDEIKEIYEIY